MDLFKKMGLKLRLSSNNTKIMKNTTKLMYKAVSRSDALSIETVGCNVGNGLGEDILV